MYVHACVHMCADVYMSAYTCFGVDKPLGQVLAWRVLHCEVQRLSQF